MTTKKKSKPSSSIPSSLDRTAEKERQAHEVAFIPDRERRLKLYSDFRTRKYPEPRSWEDYGEFMVEIQGGRLVTCCYEPQVGTVRFEFWGPFGHASKSVWHWDIDKTLTIAQTAERIARELAEAYGKKGRPQQRLFDVCEL